MKAQRLAGQRACCRFRHGRKGVRKQALRGAAIPRRWMGSACVARKIKFDEGASERSRSSEPNGNGGFI